jgi:hypothetical protein
MLGRRDMRLAGARTFVVFSIARGSLPRLLVPRTNVSPRIRARGQVGARQRAPTGRLDVAMIQSLVRKDVVANLVAGYVIVDECHHLPAFSFERVLSERFGRGISVKEPSR